MAPGELPGMRSGTSSACRLPCRLIHTAGFVLSSRQADVGRVGRPLQQAESLQHRYSSRRPRSTVRLIVAFAMSLVLTDCGGGQSTPPLVLATTTSVGNSGLLDALVPAFQQHHGVTVRTHLVGSGLALKMLADGDADVVISHAPYMESAALEAHASWQYQKIMFTDFVLVGPPTDAAHVRAATDARDAMRRIARSSERFLSRGDQSGTYEREQRLWSLAGAKPPGDRLVAAGAGMGTTLQIAGEMGAYTLTDRATFAQHASAVPMVVVFEGGPDLLNSYGVIVDPAGPNASNANAFANWLATGPGRTVIEGFRIGQQRVLHPWPLQRPRNSPTDIPD